MADYNLGTARGRIDIDTSSVDPAFRRATQSTNAFFGNVQRQSDSTRQLGTSLTTIGAVGAGAFGLVIRAAANFEQRISAVAAVSGATGGELDKIRAKALQLGKDTVFSATEAASAMEELVKAGISVHDVLNGAADATVALAAAGGIALPEAATIAANAMNAFQLKASEVPKVADLIAGAANASAIDISQFGQSLQQAGAVSHLAGVSFADTAVAIAEMGNAGIKGSDAGTSLKQMLINLIPQTAQQVVMFRQLGLITTNVTKAQEVLREHGIKPVSNEFSKLQPQLLQLAARLTGTKVTSAAARQEYVQLANSTGAMSNQFFDAHGNTKKLSEIQQVLQNSLHGMTKEQQLSTLQILFGTDAMRAAAVMAQNGAKGFNDLAANMAKVTAASVAAKRLDNVKGQLEQLRGSAETAAISIGTIFLPAMNTMLGVVKNVADAVTKLPEPVKKYGVEAGLAVAGVALLVGSSIKLYGILGPIFGVAKSAAAGLTILAASSRAAAVASAEVGTALAAEATALRVAEGGALAGSRAVGVLSKVGAGLGAAFSFMTGPIGITIAVIAALVVGIILAYKHFTKFREIVNGIGSFFVGVWKSAVDGAKKSLDALVQGFSNGSASGSGLQKAFGVVGAAARRVWDAIQELWHLFQDKVLPVFQRVRTELMSKLSSAFSQVRDAAQKIQPQIQKLWNTIQTQLIPALKKLWVQVEPVVKIIGVALFAVIAAIGIALFNFAKIIITYVLPFLIKLGGFFAGTFIKVIASVASFIAGTLIPALVSFVNFLVNGMSKGIHVVSVVIDAIIKAFHAVVDFVTGTLVPKVKGAWDQFMAGVRAVVNFLKPEIDLVVAIFNFLASLIASVIAVIVGVVVGAWHWISSTTSSVWNSVSSFISGVWNGIVAFVKNAASRVVAFLSSAWNTARNAVVSAWNAIVSFVSGGVSQFIATVKRVISAIPQPFRSGFNSAKDAVTSGISTVVTFVTGIPGKITGALGKLGSLLYNAGRDVIKGLINGIQSMVGSLTDKLKSITKLLPIHKGPPEKDKKLLRPSGQLIMQGLMAGIESQKANLVKQLSGLTKSLGSSLNGLTANASLSVAGAGMVGMTAPRIATPTPLGIAGGGLFGPGSVVVQATQTMDPQQLGDTVARKIAFKLDTGTRPATLPGSP